VVWAGVNVGKPQVSGAALYALIFRYRIIAAAMPGMAAHYTLEAQPAAPHRTMALQGLQRVLRATGGIAAMIAQVRADKVTVSAHQNHKTGLHQRAPVKRVANSLRNSVRSAGCFKARRGFLTRTT
jgi:hypothetical protein